MATNLRLRADAEAAVRAEAERSNRSQQDVIRAAVAHYLHLEGADPPPAAVLPAEGTVVPDRLLPPRSRFARAAGRILLPTSMTSADLLHRGARG